MEAMYFRIHTTIALFLGILLGTASPAHLTYVCGLDGQERTRCCCDPGATGFSLPCGLPGENEPCCETRLTMQNPAVLAGDSNGLLALASALEVMAPMTGCRPQPLVVAHSRPCDTAGPPGAHGGSLFQLNCRYLL